MRKTQNISVTLPGDLIQALDRLQETENKSCSAIVTEAVRVYSGMKEYDSLIETSSRAAKKSGIITEDQIERAVYDYRKEKRKAKSRR